MTRLLYILFILLGSISAAIGKTLPEETNDYDGQFAGWTDEEYIDYEDSIFTGLYSPVLVQRTDSQTVTTPLPPSVWTPVSPVPDAVVLDKTKEVGQIVIKSGTTPTGAKTYQVPISVYPGINGFNPSLALAYNSQQGNSIAGKGWGISGLSAITRGGKNIYHDAITQGVSMDNGDSFFLDGVRLIKVGEDEGYILYESEHGNIKVKGFTSGNVMKCFEVFYPDGSKGTFGYTYSSENYLVYPLTYLSDINNNSINYNYEFSDNHYRITKITYGRCSVLFQYTTSRPDPVLSYSGGVKMQETKLLYKIVCKLNAIVLGTYTLDYYNDSSVSLLSSISYSSAEKYYNPLRFYYGEGNAPVLFDSDYTHLTEWYKSENPNMIKIVKGKFDYNSGNDGIISLPNRNPYWKHYRNHTAFRHSQNRFDNKYKDDEKIFIYSDLNRSWAAPMPNLVTEKGFIDILCADLGGNRNEDIIKINNSVVNNTDHVTFKVFRASASLGLVNSYTRSFSFPTVHIDADNGKSIQPKFYYTGDFNGDGKMEILAISVHQPFGDTDKPSVCYIFDLAGNRILYKGHIFPYNVEFVGTRQPDAQKAINNSDRFFVMDYDGDGKTDLCHIDETGINIYTFVVRAGIFASRKVATSNILTKADLANRDIFIGEFNGDGLMDLLVSPSNETDSREWAIFNSKGDGQFEKNTFECAPNIKDINSGFITQDVDGDGLTDLVHYDVDDFVAYFAKNNSFTNGVRSFQDIRYSIPVPANINSGNCSNQLVCLKDGTVTRYSYNRNYVEATQITGMLNSLGVIEKNSYRFINSENNPAGFYIRDNDAVFPYVDILEPVPVIARSEVVVNGQSVDYNEFKYADAVVHRQGRGFCGFTRITSTNKRGQELVQTFDPFNFGLLKNETFPTYKKEYVYTVNVLPDKIAKINLTHKSETDLLKGFSSATSYQYDEFGYPLQEHTVYSDGLDVRKTNTYSSSTAIENGYNLGFLTNQTVTITRNGSSYTERVFVQEHNRRLPLKTVYYKDGNQVRQQICSYNQRGSTLSETTQYYESANSNTTAYTYDVYGRVIKETGPLGLTNEFSYNRQGQLSAILDSRGNTTTFEYDGFGREKIVTNPDGTIVATQYSWVDEQSPGLYAVTRSATGEPTVKTVYDALNREVRSCETRFDNSVVNVDRQYDAYGNLSKVSLPFCGNTASAWNEYGYDQYDRITYLKKASGKQVSYSYNSSSVTVAENGVATTKEYDVEGNLVSVTDPNGTIDYALAADGQISSITISDDIVTTFSYDKYRRKISVDDPSKGITSYSYDSAGNIAAEINADNDTVRYEYDIYDRIIKKIAPELSTTYTYNEFDDIVSVLSDNGTSKTFKYDTCGRIITAKEYGTDEKWLQKDYSYESGNISAVKYTTQLGALATESHYYSNGHLYDVKLNEKISVFKLVKENALGQSVEILTGDITRKYSFTEYGLPTGRSASGKDAVYQDFSYVFDPLKTNLLSRTDNTRNLTENFDYDVFNRLTGYGNETASYDEKGNITEKNDVGSFEYSHPEKPYAITGVSLATSSIPSISQDIAYTSFSRPKQITENGKTATFTYNAAFDRVKMMVSDCGKSILTRYYLGNCYELEVADNIHKETLYLCGDYYSAPAVVVKHSLFAETGPKYPASVLNDIDIQEPSPGIGDMSEEAPNYRLYFIIRDYLGSVTHVVSSLNGKIEQELGYDAWGRLRHPSTLETYSPGKEPALFLSRGYTGHEHLPLFGLINMNARLYDPVLGRFLSPDPFVQNYDWLQNYNRYTYALNNPLCYVDEDGRIFWAVVGVAAAIGGVVNLATHWDEIASAGGWNGVLKGASYFLSGAVAGGAGAVVSIGVAVGFGSALSITAASYSAASMGFIPGVVQGAAGGLTSGFLLGTSNSLIDGKGLGTSLGNGLSEGVSSGIFGGLLGGASGGINAVRNGKNFWNGSGTSNRDRIISEILSEEPAVTSATSQEVAESSDKGPYTIYEGYEVKKVNGKEVREVKYVGITKRDPEIRYDEHRRSGTNRATLKFHSVDDAQNLLEARIKEQMKINKYGLENLYNKRNEIALKHWKKFGIH